MKEIIFVTSNEGKITSAQKELKNIKVLPFRAELIEPRSDDIKVIATEKVKQAYALAEKPCIAMDTGFFIDAWHGFPKAYVNPALETLGLKGILKLMDQLDNRACEFRECLAYYDGENISYFESVIKCTIADEIRGQKNRNSWSELWHIVIPEGYNKTLSEFDENDFNNFYDHIEISSLGKFGVWFNSNDALK